MPYYKAQTSIASNGIRGLEFLSSQDFSVVERIRQVSENPLDIVVMLARSRQCLTRDSARKCVLGMEVLIKYVYGKSA